MKKVIWGICICLLSLVGVYTYNHNQDNLKETYSLSDSKISDYEDVIIKKGNDDEKVIALTFDDGPDEVFTPQVLDILKKNDVKATFFVVGEKVEYNKELLKRQYDEGHEIGNHTFTHINVAKNSYGKVEKEITDTQNAVKNVIGVEPKIFRPPYRAMSKSVCDIIVSKRMNIILWSNLDPRDWSNPGVGSIINTILTKVQNGNIILLHDYNNKRNDKSQTIQALEVVIPKLKEKGYKFVTISELIAHLDKNEQVQK
ncbi:oligosaccharide deacetylase [Clostridioides difficile]|uniref:polysaccharide deacetylase family protein n=1 Tax=unclassified Clostridioides TaxID=2635829 RepID=UPI0006BBA3E4|nr:oligosaccharide deacetylase [Clostridioides difficile]MCI9975074.1 polysaccharide deacetylase family protein [Clostridioides difficile]MDB3085294.1 oligosaccharide deacetylase [Clostridioides difficile]MDI0266717.1 polysaccharide deacetylase family protein [Clostridioides difficile]MDI7816847.1 polysaccharide deacetylase family protein [Clostridioides difficile]